MNATGVVELLDSKPVKTRFGEKATFSAKIGGQWYKFGFKRPAINVGDTVTLHYTPGTYGNQVDNITLGGTAAPAASEAPAPAARPAPSYGSKGVFPIPPLDGQRSIVRQNALTNARELYVGSLAEQKAGTVKCNLDVAADEIVRLAKKFEAYTAGDMDMEMAKASIAADEEAAAKTKH